MIREKSTRSQIILRQQGSILLGSMITLAVIGAVLASYLMLVRNQNLGVFRSYAWNSTVPVAEAGIEEALTHLNADGRTNVAGGNGFFVAGGKYIIKSRNIDDGRYIVGVSMSPTPVIVAEGFAKAALTGARVSRKFRVRTELSRLFTGALIALEDIDLRGKEILVDSFDSVDPNYSTNGRYDPTKRKDNGNLATNSDVEDSLNAGNAQIYGKVSTGPGGTVEIGPLGKIGDLAWHADTKNKGIKDGFVFDDMNSVFFDVRAPLGVKMALPPLQNVNVGGVTYDWVLDSGDYRINGPSTFKGKVLVRGNARLLVAENSSVDFIGVSDGITIESGASLALYVASPTATIAGKGIGNVDGNAANFTYYGLPTNTSVAYAGNGEFTGAFYAPQADLVLGGGGSNVYDLMGAVVAKTITMNGKVNMHYDENLGRIGAPRGFIATSWEEINTGWKDILTGELDLATIP